jgi:hypothetical protein
MTVTIFTTIDASVCRLSFAGKLQRGKGNLKGGPPWYVHEPLILKTGDRKQQLL